MGIWAILDTVCFGFFLLSRINLSPNDGVKIEENMRKSTIWSWHYSVYIEIYKVLDSFFNHEHEIKTFQKL